MDYIRSFDIRLEKDVYYAGEVLSGHVVLENVENIKIKGIRVILRGKAHAEWKIMKSGERRTVKDDQYLLDDKTTIWGKEKHEDDGSIPILPRGVHQLPFRFSLPQTALPCSFESKAGTIRYYIKVVIDIPYSCPPQGMKYFTIIGPHIDCMEEKYLSPMVGQDKKTVCCLCCQRGPIGLHVTLERTAYVCGESMRLHAQVENQLDQSTAVKIRLVQYVEYFIDKGVLGVNKHLSYTVLEHRSPRVPPFSQGKYDSTLEQPVKLPVVPPTLIGVCRLIQIYYVLKVSLELEKSGEDLTMEFPFTVATVPYRIPNSPQPPKVEYDFCSSHVEGGMYISPEFQLGQVYDGTMIDDENVLLYRPVYVRVLNKTDSRQIKLGSAHETPKKPHSIQAGGITCSGQSNAPSPRDTNASQNHNKKRSITSDLNSFENRTASKPRIVNAGEGPDSPTLSRPLLGAPSAENISRSVGRLDSATSIHGLSAPHWLGDPYGIAHESANTLSSSTSRTGTTIVTIPGGGRKTSAQFAASSSRRSSASSPSGASSRKGSTTIGGHANYHPVPPSPNPSSCAGDGGGGFPFITSSSRTSISVTIPEDQHPVPAADDKAGCENLSNSNGPNTTTASGCNIKAGPSNASPAAANQPRQQQKQQVVVDLHNVGAAVLRGSGVGAESLHPLPADAVPKSDPATRHSTAFLVTASSSNEERETCANFLKHSSNHKQAAGNSTSDCKNRGSSPNNPAATRSSKNSRNEDIATIHLVELSGGETGVVKRGSNS